MRLHEQDNRGGWAERNNAEKAYFLARDYNSQNEFILLMSKHYELLTSGEKNKLKNKLRVKQDGKCAICGVSERKLGKPLCLDHNHITGEVRGLLCNNCNSGIGFLDCDEWGADMLRLAINYLTTRDSLHKANADRK